ncbi:MAG: phytase [Chryseobacterium sp.]|nr:MAG: phytase [Chryseobacterium sp.]
MVLRFKMKNKNLLNIAAFALLSLSFACNGIRQKNDATAVKPLYVSDRVNFDTDDPAIWVNPDDHTKSLVIGTDKEKPVDNGGIPVFVGETAPEFRDLMGISMYKNAQGKIYAIVGRKTGPNDGGYLWQYQLSDDGTGHVKADLVRKFGKYSGKKEIEAIAVDNELGYVYYCDEQFGIRKYYADPARGNDELSLFGQGDFVVDNEGIAIYKTIGNQGYILVSDQGARQLKVYNRTGKSGAPNEHPLITTIKYSANQTDGIDVVSVPLNGDFKHGLLVAMSDDKTFHFYRWEDIAGKKLTVNH